MTRHSEDDWRMVWEVWRLTDGTDVRVALYRQRRTDPPDTIPLIPKSGALVVGPSTHDPDTRLFTPDELAEGVRWLIANGRGRTL